MGQTKEQKQAMERLQQALIAYCGLPPQKWTFELARDVLKQKVAELSEKDEGLGTTQFRLKGTVYTLKVRNGKKKIEIVLTDVLKNTRTASSQAIAQQKKDAGQSSRHSGAAGGAEAQTLAKNSDNTKRMLKIEGPNKFSERADALFATCDPSRDPDQRPGWTDKTYKKAFATLRKAFKTGRKVVFLDGEGGSAKKFWQLGITVLDTATGELYDIGEYSSVADGYVKQKGVDRLSLIESSTMPILTAIFDDVKAKLKSGEFACICVHGGSDHRFLREYFDLTSCCTLKALNFMYGASAGGNNQFLKSLADVSMSGDFMCKLLVGRTHKHEGLGDARAQALFTWRSFGAYERWCDGTESSYDVLAGRGVRKAPRKRASRAKSGGKAKAARTRAPFEDYDEESDEESDFGVPVFYDSE